MQPGEGILVAKIPDNHTWPVAVAVDGLMDTQQHPFGELRFPHPVASKAKRDFIEDIESQLITEADKAFRVGIMRHADRVNVGRLHQLDILQPMLAPGCPTDIRVLVVTIDTAQLDHLAINPENAAICADFPESDPVVP